MPGDSQRSGAFGTLTLTLLSWFAGVTCPAPPPKRPAVPYLCEQVTKARPGYGVAYRNTVRNDDYHFSVRIPDDLVGWGAAYSAPFHGFTIFLPGDGACIEFRIAMEVLLPEDNVSAGGRPLTSGIRVGNRVGEQTNQVGAVRGTDVENIVVSLQVPHGSEAHDSDTHDINVTLITTKADAARNRRILAQFLCSFHFD